MQKTPTSLPVTVSLEIYLAALPPLYSVALAVCVLSLAATNLTALVWGFVPSPRFIPARHHAKAKRATSILGATLLAVAVAPLLPGAHAELRALVGLVSGAISGPLYSLLRPTIEAKTGLKLPQSLATEGESDESD